MTNRERIESMDDKELARFLVNDTWGWPWCDPDAPADAKNNCLKWGKGLEDFCNKCCEEWLKKEVVENGN